MTGKLLGCPFCGNSETDTHHIDCVVVQEQVKTTIGWGLPAEKPYKMFYVSCGRCGARSGVGIEGYNALSGTTITEEEARQIAIDKWNMRAST